MFSALDLDGNVKNLKNFFLTFFEIFGSKFTNFKNYTNELHAFCTKNFHGVLEPLWPPTIRPPCTLR